MNKYYVTTSRGWLAEVADTAEKAYATCRKLRETNGINYKVIKPTPWRLVLGNPVALSIPPDANIVIENGVAYSFLRQSYYEAHATDNSGTWVCPYTKAEGVLDTTWLAKWHE